MAPARGEACMQGLVPACIVMCKTFQHCSVADSWAGSFEQATERLLLTSPAAPAASAVHAGMHGAQPHGSASGTLWLPLRWLCWSARSATSPAGELVAPVCARAGIVLLRRASTTTPYHGHAQ